MKWIGEARLVPPYGGFSAGDELDGRVPADVQKDLKVQGLVSDGTADAQGMPEVLATAPEDEK